MLSVAPRLASAPPRGMRPYILLVDDHEPSLRQLSQVVDGAGHPCLAAGSAAEALHYLDRRRPQVVVTDLSMPNLDGRGLACWLNARYPSIPLILLTGQDLDCQAKAALRRSFTAVLSKPVDVESFLDRLDRMMPPPPGSSRT